MFSVANVYLDHLKFCLRILMVEGICVVVNIMLTPMSVMSQPPAMYNNNNCLKSNIQCIEIRVQWTVHLGSSHMHVHAVTRVHAVTPKLVICVMYLT